MIPSDIKFDGNATPPQFTDNADQVIERGTHIRVKIKGIRGEVGQMYAIATIKEDYLGSVSTIQTIFQNTLLTFNAALCSRLEGTTLQQLCFTRNITKSAKKFRGYSCRSRRREVRQAILSPVTTQKASTQQRNGPYKVIA